MKKQTITDNKNNSNYKIKYFYIILFSHPISEHPNRQINRTYQNQLNILVILSRKIDFDKSEYQQR